MWDEFEILNEKFFSRAKTLTMKRGLTLIQQKTNNKLGWHDKTPDAARSGDWKISVPDWCIDQRNQMTGPADDEKLVMKLINSGAPGVMLDLEDSCANGPNIQNGYGNIICALERCYHKGDAKPVIFTRPRGLHIFDEVKIDGRTVKVSAALLDVCTIVLLTQHSHLSHPPCFYIPKSESAEEALWWRDLFRDLADVLGKPTDYIKCMALVESYPLAFQMEEFIYNLRDHIMGLNLGRWDYMASLIHFKLNDPDWVLPDRNLISHSVPFFQNLRYKLVDVCHKRGILAIGGMTALYPSRKDKELNAHALEILEKDKKNEALCGFDGAWTGHPDQNAIAMDAFPFPNQLSRDDDIKLVASQVSLDAKPSFTKESITWKGTQEAIKTSILYRLGVLKGKGASLIEGYMEDLATDRINRLMIAQRMKHIQTYNNTVIVGEFDDITNKIITDNGLWDNAAEILLVREAAAITLQSILTNKF